MIKLTKTFKKVFNFFRYLSSIICYFNDYTIEKELFNRKKQVKIENFMKICENFN